MHARPPARGDDGLLGGGVRGVLPLRPRPARGAAGVSEERPPDFEGAACPVPLTHRDRIVLGHGGGGRLMSDLIRSVFLPRIGNPTLEIGDDAALPPGLEAIAPGEAIAVSTDAHVVRPLFFPGGDIGRLAVCGTVNDVAMVGAVPLWLTVGFILEEGIEVDVLTRIAESMRAAAAEAGVMIVAGDTKVAERGKVDRLYVSTTGIGRVPAGRQTSGRFARPGDAVLVSGTLGDHGIAVLAAREELAFETAVRSDVAPLNRLVEALYAASSEVHVLRDPTRGGLAAALNEIAQASRVAIELEEAAIPIREEVQAACEILGFDPLQIANEGKLVAILPEEHAEAALAALR
ncbi:MAG: hydrogenase expression/formation protein HypE, partial [Candidatus Eisenbacteria bacterium]|nr:hydrogenase expression/formation protein HypE [Candidatus Latescibacterota bacterium]MBD3300832.1 hydrogenase expression/formation protein HypE [Candidatus Eisenbacteria bacterium]